MILINRLISMINLHLELTSIVQVCRINNLGELIRINWFDNLTCYIQFNF